jgi:hypothetical protein
MVRRGVVLVDAIAGAVLLGGTLAVVIGIAGRSLTLQARGEEAQIAAMLLDEQLNMVLMHGPEAYQQSQPMQGACPPPYERYRYEIEIDGGVGLDPFFVSATVRWMNGRTERSETVETLMARRLGEEPDPERRPEEPIQRY